MKKFNLPAFSGQSGETQVMGVYYKAFVWFLYHSCNRSKTTKQIQLIKSKFLSLT